MEIQTNGNESPGELAVRHGIASYQSIVIERDEYKAKLETAEKLISVYKIEIEGYRAQAAAESTRTITYQNERDEAVVRYASLERTIEDIYAIILRSKADPTV